ncbi:hypothetical protein GCM10023321_08190 [Pseudonocardia eucalypti]|uniref:SHOCT domain-containing protein n=1 Tax=Pseudonocardia eucalypti TaxID=648755 RepID=A0ABP9PJX5_9PSEU|nr:putative membrane protein [Pseudonocardia eucalypti]
MAPELQAETERLIRAELPDRNSGPAITIGVAPRAPDRTIVGPRGPRELNGVEVMRDSMMMGMWLWGGLGLLILLAILSLLVLAAVWLMRQLGTHRSPSATDPATTPVSGHDPALDTLRQRYALGEIDAEDYQQRLNVLNQR